MKDGFPSHLSDDEIATFEIADRYEQAYGSARLGWLIADGADNDDLWELANLGNKKISGNEQLGQWLESLSQEEMNFIRKLFRLRTRNS